MTTANGKGLGSSIWASRGVSHANHRSRSVPPDSSPTNLNNPTTSTMTTRLRAAAPTGDLTPAQALHRFEQTCKRLKWKMIDLFQSLERASAPEQWGFEPEDAEMNFKVDFHEAYIWIEQALVFLQLVFGVVIPRGMNAQGGRSGGATHAYHHNVLQALADASSPLFSTLGKGDVKEALWKAKELRNRWKDAAVTSGQGTGEAGDTPPRQMYSVDWIVKTIMRGLEEAYPLARARADEEKLKEGLKEQKLGEGQGEVLPEEGWNWMMEDGDTEMMDV